MHFHKGIERSTKYLHHISVVVWERERERERVRERENERERMRERKRHNFGHNKKA